MDSTSSSATGNGSSASTGSQQFLTFHCGDEEFAVDILRVREIKGWCAVTQLPEAPDYVLGIVNLRGDPVPVVDLRARFGLETRTPDTSTVMLVVTAQTPRGDRNVGICVDGVSDVRAVDPRTVVPPPDLGAKDVYGYVNGVVSENSTILMILDIDRIIGIALTVREAA